MFQHKKIKSSNLSNEDMNVHFLFELASDGN